MANPSPRSLPAAIHTVEQVRAMDRYAVERLGISGYALMTRAGEAALRVLRTHWPSCKTVVVVCGAGNNAGDGYVLARLASAAGMHVTTMGLFDPTALQGDALVAWNEFVATGGALTDWSADELSRADVLVDAIFGTGLSRPLDDRVSRCVAAMNSSGAPILALDIPSGLDANTGLVSGVAIKADYTVTFVGLKLGFFLGVALDYTGKIEFDDLAIASAGEQQLPVARRIDSEWLQTILPKRSRLAHKGTGGHVLVIGGGIGMPGAIRLAGEACLRVGAGLVTVVTHPQNIASISIERPELIVRAVQGEQLIALIDRADVVAIGPGLGRDEWAHELVGAAFKSNKPLVVDADALNLLAQHPLRRGNWILTPHPGEAARLLGCTPGAIQNNRLRSARSLVERYGGVAVLKGANTWVVDEGDLPSVCDRGNPGMATAGMGDVLTGVIAGLLAQLGIHRMQLAPASSCMPLLPTRQSTGLAHMSIVACWRVICFMNCQTLSVAMNEMRKIAVRSDSAERTRSLGAAMGRWAVRWSAGQSLMIALNGELGAGKTTLVTGFLQELGFSGVARSPTYTLIEPYELSDRSIYHLDLYRIVDARELEMLALRDLVNPRSILLVEWATRGGLNLPTADVSINMSYASQSSASLRIIELEALTTAGNELKASVQASTDIERVSP